MPASELTQFGYQVIHVSHRGRLGGKDPPGGRGTPPRRCGKPTVDGIPDHCGNRHVALSGESLHSLVPLLVEEEL
jgi:hypothetical protein